MNDSLEILAVLVEQMYRVFSMSHHFQSNSSKQDGCENIIAGAIFMGMGQVPSEKP
jgi:hypothetical protein